MNTIKKLSSLLLLSALAFVGCSDDDYPSQPDWSKITPPEDVVDPTSPVEATNIVVAHRGGATEAGTAYPDNSIASLNYAMSLGCYASECDIYWTKDDKVVVAHADGNCQINGLYPWEHTLAEIRATGKLSNGETIPSLEEFIDKVMEQGSCTRLWLDIKNITVPSTLTQYPTAACRRACEIITAKAAKNFVEFICTGNATVMSNSVTYANEAGVPIGWMSNSSAAIYNSKSYPWANLSSEYIYKNGVLVGPRSIDEFKKAGVKISIFNADTDADMQYYISKAADMKAICTNYPKKLIEKMK